MRAAGGTPMEFNTVAISDGITMGTKGMKTSLVSREVIADSIELMAAAISSTPSSCLAACDKTIPGAVMALARLDIPAVMLYGGSIAPGRWHDRDVTILDVFEAVGAHAAGKMTDEELRVARGRRQSRRRRLRRASSPPTRWPARSRRWGSRPAAPRWSPPRTPTSDGRRADRRAGDARTRRRPAPEPGDHPRVARERDRLRLRLRRLDQRRPAPARGRSRGRGRARRSTTSSAISQRTPLLADLKPGGRFVATDLYRAGGVPLILNRLAEAGLLHADALTVTGRTIGEEAAAAVEAEGQEVVPPAVGPAEARGRAGDPAWQPGSRRRGGQARGHRAHGPDRPGAGVRVRGGLLPPRSRRRRSSPATSIVIRNEGPAGGPGMREMLQVTAAIVGEGLGEEVGAAHRWALLRRDPRPDGRPRRARGGQGRADRGAARGRRGDDRRRGARALGRRSPTRDRRARGRLRAARPPYATGVLAKYANSVGSASHGRDHRRAARKSSSRRLKRTGRSAIGTWPQGSKTSRRAPAIRCA